MHIGLVGHKGAGKNLAAEFIVKELPDFWPLAFADPLREACTIIFGLNSKEMHDRDLKEVPLERYPFESPRQILQRVGTECIRSQYPEAWIEAWKHRIKPFPDTVTTDVRFQNEAAAIVELGGKLIRIERPADRLPDNQRDLHPSETVLEGIATDKTIINDGSVNLFRARVLTALWELKEGR